MPIDNLSKITSRSGINTTILLEAGNVNVTGIVTAAGFNGPFTGGGTIAAGIITGTGLEISGISTLNDSVRVGGHSVLTGTPHSYNYGRGAQDGGLSVYAREAAIEVVGDDDGGHGGSVLIRTPTEGFGFVINPSSNSLELKAFTSTNDNFTIHNTGQNVSSLITQLRVVKDGAVELYNNGSKKFETTGAGVTVTGIGTFTSQGVTAVFNSGAANDGRLEFHYNNSRVGLLAYHSDRLEMQSDSSKDFTIRTGGAEERLRITSDGNVGINTTERSIAGMSRYLSVSARNVTNGGAAVELVGARTGGDQTLGVINFVNEDSNVAQITAKYQGSTTTGSLQFLTSGDERLRINEDGKVGIGTDDPKSSAQLDIWKYPDSSAPTLRLGSAIYQSEQEAIRFGRTDHASDIRYHSILSYHDASAGSNYLRFKLHDGSTTTSQSDIMTLRGDGDVGIGTTNPIVRLEVEEYITAGFSPDASVIVANNILRLENKGSESFSGMMFRTAGGGDAHFGSYQNLTSANDCTFYFSNQTDSGGGQLLATLDSATGNFVVNKGKVGIGTTVPGGNLEINVATTTTNMITLDVAGTNFAKIGHNSASGTAVLDVRSEGHTRFLTGGNNERLRITSDGLVKWDGHTLAERNSATGVAGGLIYNSEGKIFQYYDGSGWISLNTTNQIVATGGNSVATSSGYRIHTFTGAGTFVITSGVGEVEVLVVGGGGSEGGDSSGCHAGGGGGGGGVVYKKMNLSAGNYPISIGQGGTYRNNGGNTVFGNGTDHQITAVGGGAGGPTLTGDGNAGGSGGGGSRHTTTNQGGAAQQPGTTDGGFGNAGGNTGSNTSPGGGGGAGGAGTDGSNGGLGGAGKQFTQFGVTTYFGAGGNGNSSGGSEGQTQASTNGADLTGAGGGGSPGEGTRFHGGSGRVMIRYPAAS